MSKHITERNLRRTISRATLTEVYKLRKSKYENLFLFGFVNVKIRRYLLTFVGNNKKYYFYS